MEKQPFTIVSGKTAAAAFKGVHSKSMSKVAEAEPSMLKPFDLLTNALVGGLGLVGQQGIIQGRTLPSLRAWMVYTMQKKSGQV